MQLPNPVPEQFLLDFVETELICAGDFWEVQSGLRSLLLANANSQVEWLGVAFDTRIAMDVQRGPAGKLEFLNSVNPFGDLQQEVFDFWCATANAVNTAAVRSRLHHLLFLSRHGNPGQHARDAAAAYLELGNGSWIGVHRVRCLEWAFHLYKSVGESTGIASVIQALLALALEALEDEAPLPGVSLPALELVAREIPSDPILAELILKAREKYLDSRLTSDTIRIQKVIHKGDLAKIEKLNREMVEAFLLEADQSAGIVRMKFLEDGAQLAQKYGLSDLQDEAIRRMQAIDFESLGMVKIQSEVVIEGEALDAMRRQIDSRVALLVDGRSMIDAFSILISSKPPSGSLSDNEEQIAHLDQEFPLQALFTTTQVREDGLPSYTDVSAADSRDRKLSGMETVHMFDPFEPTSRYIFSILEAHSPTEPELAQMLTLGGIVDPDTAQQIAISLLDFQLGNYFSSATRALPAIETIARAQLSALGVPTYRTQSGERRAGIAQLGGLLPELEPYIDPSWFRFLQTFLVGKFGPNFRNQLLHGYITEVRARECAFTLLCALYLIGVQLAVPSPEAPSGS